MEKLNLGRHESSLDRKYNIFFQENINYKHV